jgi:integrase
LVGWYLMAPPLTHLSEGGWLIAMGPLFRAAIDKTKKLGPGAISRTDVWYMARRRAFDAGIETAIGCHTFRATRIADYLTNGGRIAIAQRMAGHSNGKGDRPLTTGATMIYQAWARWSGSGFNREGGGRQMRLL